MNWYADTFTYDDRCWIEENVTERLFFFFMGETKSSRNEFNIQIEIGRIPRCMVNWIRQRSQFINDFFFLFERCEAKNDNEETGNWIFAVCLRRFLCTNWRESCFVYIESRAYVFVCVICWHQSLALHLFLSVYALNTKRDAEKTTTARNHAVEPHVFINSGASVDLCHIPFEIGESDASALLVDGKDG